MKFHLDMTLPLNGEIFVFGSNEAGYHGGGAARIAYKIYGAKCGMGTGLVGQTYAIPTKDSAINSLPLDVIKLNINKFIKFTLNNPDLSFFVTGVGTGLAGYSAEEIAPLFTGAINCSFPNNWKGYLGDSDALSK